MADNSPFSGLKLSDQVDSPTRPLDQQLFSSPTSVAAKPEPAPKLDAATPVKESSAGQAQKPANQDSLQIGKEGSREIGKEASLEGKREVGQLFNLSDKPARKDSFLFTDEEFEAMDDLKLDLRRVHGLKATKNDLARCGLGFLLDDYNHRGDKSELVTRVRQKKVNQ